MSVYSPLLLPPSQLRGRELREILPPHDPRAFARFSQWLFVSHLPACWEVHSKFPRLPRRASARGWARAASAWGAEDVRALVDRLFTPLRAQRVLLDACFSAIGRRRALFVVLSGYFHTSSSFGFSLFSFLARAPLLSSSFIYIFVYLFFNGIFSLGIDIAYRCSIGGSLFACRK